MKMCILATTCRIWVITLEVCLLTLRAYPNYTSGLSSHSRAGRCKIAPLDDTSILFCTELEYVPNKIFGYRDISECHGMCSTFFDTFWSKNVISTKKIINFCLP